MTGITYRDAMVIYRLITPDEQEARRFLSELKAPLQGKITVDAGKICGVIGLSLY